MSDSEFEERYAELAAKETYLETSHEDAIERVREAFTETGGFGNPMEFSPSENIREHTGEEIPPTRVIGIGNPHAGKKVAEATRGDAATLFPCSVVVQQVADERQRVSHVSLLRVIEAVGLGPEDPDEDWQDALAIASEGVEAAFEELKASDLAAPAPVAD